MVESDRKQFAALMVALSEIFDGGKELSKERIQLYWLALKEYTIEQVQQAASDIIRERVYPSLPKPAEIIEAIRGKESDRATMAWLEVIYALRRIGTYESVRFSNPAIHAVIEHMGGWPEMGNMPTEEEKWKQREFEKLYTLMEGKKDPPEYLPGRIEIDNAARGFQKHVPEPIAIGFDGVKRIENIA